MARFTQDPIAIVGFACRLPGDCNTPKEFWDFLEKGGIASLLPPATRFSLPTHHDGSKKPGTMASPGGMFINADPRDIDAPFFKLSKTEAISMDPQQRQLLEVVYEGLENSGITLDEVNNTSVGCFVSSYACDYADIQARDPENRAPAATVGIGRAMLSNRISHFLNIKGPSMTVDTACSGSLVGADIAIRYLQTREISGAIVAGCNMYLSPEHVMDSMSANGTASATGCCHTFDAKANGYIKSEAVNMIFLKGLDDAVRDGNPIRAVIRGSATGSDGWTAGIASPNTQAQAATIRQAYRNANIQNFTDTSYVECHGTGTRAGDAIEVDGVASVFSSSRTEGLPLQIGSVKSNIGHSEPAAGISSVLKVILSMEKGIIPGNPTFEDPNPNINFESIKLRPSRTNRRWRVPPRSRRAGVNSFGYGGSNVHLIVDSAVGLSNHKSSYLGDDDDMFDLDDDNVPYARPYLLLFSGNDERSMKDYTSALDQHLSNPAVRISFRDLAHTLSKKRTHHFHRGYSVSAKGKFDPRTLVTGKKSSTNPRIGLVFTGQGAQWPQMGKDLISTFPVAKSRLIHLNNMLRDLPDGPEWSLLEELSVPRTPEFYKRPELSQTLVTALQLALLAVLETAGVSYHAVVGHSSGEIAGAVAAGYVTAEDAIRIAYYRGVATTAGTTGSTKGALGMMAIGVGEDTANEYCASSSNVQVACVNSPRSVTLSGDRTELQLLENRITKDGHFARLLAVDAAYHSAYMVDAAAQYRTLMLEHCAWEQPAPKEVIMYSSVTGNQAERDVRSPAYWEKNMVQQVLFNAAVTTMLQLEELDMLIEIGPSSALAGPIKQILHSASNSVQYLPAWKRGPDPLTALFDTVGSLFIRGTPLNLSKFNEDEDPQSPSTIVDLPNYRWNHSTKYWYESRASKDWRFRRFLRHDLLGSKVLSTPWTQPTWQNTLRIQDVPWLRDHRLGESIVFPAAGYVSMAIEAMFQMAKATGLVAEESNVAQLTYQLRNVNFLKAMILEDGGADNHLVLTLNPLYGSNETWHTFNVLSMIDSITNTHSTGLIRFGAYHPAQPSPTDLQSLQYSTPANVWYKSMKDVGYSFGPSFQKQLAIECIAGSRKGRSLINLKGPESLYNQSPYPLHPVVIDGCFQTSSAPIWKGDRSSIHTVLIPKMIDELIIPSQPLSTNDGMAISQAVFVGLGRESNPTSFSSDVSVFDSKSGDCVFQMSGLTFSGLERNPSPSDAHVYNRLIWNPDPSFCSQIELKQLLLNAFDCESTESGLLQRVNKLFDMIAFKNPEVKVLEINANENDGQSMWIEGRNSIAFDRTACSSLHLYTISPKTIQEDISRYASAGNISTSHSDSLEASDLTNLGAFNIVLVKSSYDPLGLLKAIRKVRGLLRPKGYFLLFNGAPEGIASDAYGDLISLAVSQSTGFEAPPVLTSLPWIPGMQDAVSQFVFGIADDGSPVNTFDLETSVSVACFSVQPHAGLDSFLPALSASEWKFDTHMLPFSTIPPNSIVLIVEELFTTFLSSISSDAWTALQTLVQNGCRILWVTSGSQMAVTDPERSLIHGLARSICSENPDCVFMTLDVASGAPQNAVRGINQVLRRLRDAKTSKDTDTEFVERNGVVHVGRVMLDDRVNTQEKANVDGPDPETQSLFDQDATVRLISERPGFLDSLTYVSIPDSENTLQEGHVEVDVHAVSLNFKDMAISMNLVPGNEHLLGLEGSGIVRRVGEGIDPAWIGRRVVVNRKGSLANKVHGRVEGEIHPIPDWLSFNDASTLTTVFSTVIYSLFDLANTQRGQTVLIHSAAGGVGLAAIQICRYLGAEIYATTSSEEKKSFLINEIGIPAERILSSRSVEDFEPALMQLTNGKGVDVVLNSLTGEMLHASWRCIATSGTFVEIGKKDIIDRASISMEPFNWNASYRAVDMSHECISFPLKARLLTQIFDLLENGHIQPVYVGKMFAFNDVHAAFRYMRSGTNIGKTVISRSAQGNDAVLVRPLKPALSLDKDASYLIVGGLKGLCGSLAMYLARKGATNITVLSRSGYDDDKSQAVIRDIDSLGAHVDLVVGDVTDVDAVKRAFVNTSKPIRGIIQGAMVLRDKMYDSMTLNEFSTTLSAKVVGTWNLHNVAIELGVPLAFFTLLSSICGVAGQKGQANYSAANAFLDSFAVYRHSLGLPATSVDLGVIEDVGYVNERETLGKRLLAQGWIPIGEALLHKILYFSILQQGSAPPNPESSTQLITGIPFPLPKDSPAQRDPRFSHLRKSVKANAVEDGSDGSDDCDQSWIAMLKSGWRAIGDEQNSKHPQLVDLVVKLAGARLTRSLGMDEEMDPARPLASYGIDSLVAVEFRNWARTDLEVEVATLEIVGGKTLAALAAVIVKKGFERFGGMKVED